MSYLIEENPDRFVLFPIQYENLWRFYKKAQASFWTAEELDLSKDYSDFKTLKPDEREFILRILGFFSASDGIVVENLVTCFASEVQLPEARCFYGFQTMIENVHSEVYSLMIDTLVKDESKKRELFRAIEYHPATAAKARWALKFISSTLPANASAQQKLTDFSLRCLAFACVEGIMFSSSFAALFWLKKKGLCPGLTNSNEFISRDEGMHRDFAVELLLMIKKDADTWLDESVAHELVDSAVQVELLFVRETLPTNLESINRKTMSTYVQFVANHLLTSLGFNSLYFEPGSAHPVQNPFDFMDPISLDGKTNFFEKRVSEYAMANVLTGPDIGFGVDGDF